jgi:hypothetical protein
MKTFVSRSFPFQLSDKREPKLAMWPEELFAVERQDGQAGQLDASSFSRIGCPISSHVLMISDVSIRREFQNDPMIARRLGQWWESAFEAFERLLNWGYLRMYWAYAFAAAAGIRIEDERGFEDRFQHSGQGVLYWPGW